MGVHNYLVGVCRAGFHCIANQLFINNTTETLISVLGIVSS